MKKNAGETELLKWIAIFSQHDSNCNKWLFRETIYNAFVSDTASQMQFKIFTKTWSQMADLDNTSIGKCKIPVNRKSREFMIHKKRYLEYYIVKTTDNIADHLLPFEKLDSRMNVKSDSNNRSDMIDDKSDNTNKSNNPSGIPIENLETYFDHSDLVSSPTNITLPDQLLSQNEIDLLHSSWKIENDNKLANEYINTSFNLDHSLLPRHDIRPHVKHCVLVPTIPVHDLKLADEGTKWHCVLQLAKCNYEMLSKSQHLYLAEAVGRKESYLLGYRKPFSGHTLMGWWKKHEKESKSGLHPQDCFKRKKYKDRKTYLGMIQELFPDFLHKLYRYATKILGHNCNNYRIRHLMMRKARRDFPNCVIRGCLNITNHSFKVFFQSNNGYYKKLCTKPVRSTICHNTGVGTRLSSMGR